MELNPVFVFALGDRVRIIESGEVGEAVGRAQYRAADDGYLIRYKAADGRACEQWWTVGALALAEQAPAIP